MIDQPPAPVLCDRLLLETLAKAAENLGFLSSDTIDALKRLGEIDDLGQSEETQDLWRSLLIDAVHALKIRDSREKAHIQQWNLNDSRNNKVRHQNAYGITELAEYFSEFVKFEGALYASESHYRDHVTHVLRVWLIGVYLLTEHSNGIDELFLDWGEKLIIGSAERWAMWTLISLCHDLGYPLEKTHKLNDVMNRMLSHFGNISTSQYHYSFQAQHQKLIDTVLTLVSSKAVQLDKGKYTTRVQAKFLVKFAHSLEEFRHGIISTLVMLKTLVYFLETDYDHPAIGALSEEDARQFHIRREILRAIASHTCTDIYHLRIDTLSFLLILADELQEWGRPAFRQLKLGPGGDGSAHVTVSRCDLCKGVFAAEINYGDTPLPGEVIKKRFQEFGKLLRAAIMDDDRKIRLTWTITNGGRHCFAYDSAKKPFEELRYTVNDEDCTDTLYGPS